MQNVKINDQDYSKIDKKYKVYISNILNMAKIKECILESRLCRYFMYIPLESYYLYIKLKIWTSSDKKFVISKYTKVFAEAPNLDNPSTINEFINHRKIYERSPLYTLCSDKYKVREYVSQKIGQEYLIPLIAASHSVKIIDFDALPNSFIAKVNHGSGQNMIVEDKSKKDLEQMRVMFYYWMKRNHYYNTREWQYKNIKPMIVVEELLIDENKNVPKDYKLHVINGKAEIIQIDTERFSDHKRVFYSPDWEELDFMWSPVDSNGNQKYQKADPQQKPDSLQEMVQISEKLAREFKYVRVDLYEFNGKIYFGELTFTHEDGLAKFFPEKYDYYYGELLLK